MNTLRSPVPWIGGKYYMAPFILSAFPPARDYDVYVEPFAGACHVIAQKQRGRHYEVVNDVNGDLVNFWLQLRDHAGDIVQALETLPYSRQLHYDYHRSLFDGTDLSAVERAARWFYVLQSSFSAQMKPTSPGWKSAPRDIGRG
jgi:DNA adenine methylase